MSAVSSVHCQFHLGAQSQSLDFFSATWWEEKCCVYLSIAINEAFTFWIWLTQHPALLGLSAASRFLETRAIFLEVVMQLLPLVVLSDSLFLFESEYVSAVETDCVIVFVFPFSRVENGTGAHFPCLLDQQHMPRKPVELVFNGLSVTVNKRPILRDINGVVRPGELLAVMGPSGKSNNKVRSPIN